MRTLGRQLWKNLDWTLAPKINEYHPGEESPSGRSGECRGGEARLSAPAGEGKGDWRGDGGLALQHNLNQRFVNLAMSFGTTGNSRQKPCSLTEHALQQDSFCIIQLSKACSRYLKESQYFRDLPNEHNRLE